MAPLPPLDWDDLEQALRRVVEAVRLAPRDVPAAVASALGVLGTAREEVTRAGGAGDAVAALAAIERAVAACGRDLGHADRRIRGAAERLERLRAGDASPPVPAGPWAAV